MVRAFVAPVMVAPGHRQNPKAKDAAENTTLMVVLLAARWSVAVPLREMLAVVAPVLVTLAVSPSGSPVNVTPGTAPPVTPRKVLLLPPDKVTFTLPSKVPGVVADSVKVSVA